MVELRIENLTKTFGNVVAVDNLSLTIGDKEFFVLLGPSGSGKSTVLNIIAGLEEATSGHVYFDDQVIDKVQTEKRDIAMVFQTYALYPHMNAFDNIAFGLRIRKVNEDEIKKRVENTAEMLGVKHLLQRKPHELSGGERQRIALARAIVRKPRVFLLDEPLSNIDAKLRAEMRVELIRLHKAIGVTMIYVTHDQVEAMTMADRVAILDKGKLMQVDTPLGVYQSPRNLFVAGFVGTPAMNFIDCSLVERKEGIFLESDVATLKVPKKFEELLRNRVSSELIIGIRPDDIIVEFTKREKEAIESEVYAIEKLGKEIIVDLRVGARILKSITTPDFDAEMGDKVWMIINKEKMHIFDRKTGISLS